MFNLLTPWFFDSLNGSDVSTIHQLDPKLGVLGLMNEK